MPEHKHYMILSFMILTCFMKSCNVDLAIAAIFEDEQTLESLGVPTTRTSKDDKPTSNFGRRLIIFMKMNLIRCFLIYIVV